ncbi:MAG: hypothetical protein ACE5HZ_04640 [Fidelibacterota bacterium]
MIAISLKNGWARFARADIEGESPVLKEIGEIPLPVPLEDPDLHSDRLTFLIGELFEQIYEAAGGGDRDLYVSLGEEWMESDILEVDSRLTQEEKETYLDWVLHQRLGSMSDDSEPFFCLLPDGRENVDRVLVSVITVPLIRAVHGAVLKMGAIPVWMEAGVLSLDRVSGALDDGRATRTLAMEPAGSAYRGLFHDRGQLRGLALFRLRAGKAQEVVTKGDRALVSGCLEDLNAYLAGQDLSPNLHLFLSGEVSRHTLKALTHSGTVEGILTVVNPFAGLGTEGISLPDITHGSWYVDVRGLIEKGIQ